jgi:hypothetical protein
MAKTIRKVALEPIAPPQSLSRPAGYTVLAVSVGWDGAAIRLLSAEDTVDKVFARTVRPEGTSFAKTKTEGEYSAILVVSGPKGSDEIRLSGLTATFPSVEVLPRNDVLVVAPRCRLFPDGTHELNAKIFDSSGAAKHEFLLGDGIEHVQVDVRGNIWVGYFDEGVYGNRGWGEYGRPFGSAGLSCFTDRGQRIWDFRPPDGFDVISDCYALNVTRKDVWAYYYTDFPFARIDSDGNVRCWKTESRGARSLAIGEGRVLLYGGYGDRGSDCKLFDFVDQQVELAADVSLVLPAGVELQKSTVIGRNSELHVFSGDNWYQFSVEAVG